MTKLYKLSVFLLLLIASGSVYAQQLKLPKKVKKAMTLVDTTQIRADIAYLADDKLLGRAPGTPGYQMAVDYVIGRLKSMGVKPAGEDGGWLQKVRFRKASIKDASVSFDKGQLPDSLTANGKNYAVYPNPSLKDVEVSGGLAFAGFGVSEPSLGYDDYAGINVKGKIVLIVRGAPDKFSSSVSAHTGNTTTILKTAAEHGAVGVVMCSVDSTARVNAMRGGINSVMGKDGKVVISRIYYSDQVKVLGSFGYKLFNPFVKSAGKNIPEILAKLKGGSPDSFVINADASFKYSSTYQDIESYNVIGKIEGSDPKLKNEYVVHSAHLDHLGVGRPVEGDSIYNGAHDNASGVASVLAISKIYTGIKNKPKRSILTVLLTGEEMGDLGSGYFANTPTVPKSSIVADVNTDMPTIIAPLLSVTALGAEHSSLAKQVDEAAGYLNLSVEPDPEPKQARFTRSDQYSFVVNGIPALHIKYGAKTADGKNNLNDFVAKWRAKYYHKPQDDINGIFNFTAGKTYAQLNFLIGYLVAQDVARPTWNKGDIFEVK